SSMMANILGLRFRSALAGALVTVSAAKIILHTAHVGLVTHPLTKRSARVSSTQYTDSHGGLQSSAAGAEIFSCRPRPDVIRYCYGRTNTLKIGFLSHMPRHRLGCERRRWRAAVYVYAGEPRVAFTGKGPRSQAL